MSDMVEFTLDGKEIRVPSGTLVIKAAEDHGTYIPRFCWHRRMKPVGMCRMCLVEVEGPRGKTLTTACTLPVADRMVVDTKSEVVKKAQEGVLEFLLINHPLDCPVCDRGGECPLQDQALAHGPGESRYVDPKRVWKKPIPLSPLVLLDRERCVLCARCTRFCDQISGERFIELFDRGAAEQVAIAPDGGSAIVQIIDGSIGLWVIDFARGTLTPLVTTGGSSQAPVWTKDGKRVIYRATRNGVRNLYWKSVDGTGDEERLTTKPGFLHTPSSISADGEWVIFTEVSPQTGRKQLRLHLTGSREIEPMSEKDPDYAGQVSPDGRWLAQFHVEDPQDMLDPDPVSGRHMHAVSLQFTPLQPSGPAVTVARSPEA